MLGLRCCIGSSPVAASRATLLIAVQGLLTAVGFLTVLGSHCAGSSCCQAQALGRGLQELRLTVSGAAVPGL